MIFIFGFNHQINFNAGPLAEETCTKCNVRDFWNLEKTTFWFTVFFIPLIPYKTSYFKRCTSCNFQLPLEKEEYNGHQPFARLNLQVIHGKISEEEYQTKKSSLS